MNVKVIDAMRQYLTDNGVRYNDTISAMVDRRNQGKVFSFSEHLAALIYALLSNQAKWSRIVTHLREIDELFFHYDPEKIKQHRGKYFSDGVCKLKCGNIRISDQMESLSYNIQMMERIANEYGSMDAFVTSGSAREIVKKLSRTGSPYKIKMLGETLAWEYIRNVGIDACKPDRHLRRFFGRDRMGHSRDTIATEEETISQVEAASKKCGLPCSTIDNIIWNYCADGYGQICTSTPKCEKCVIRASCRFPKK